MEFGWPDMTRYDLSRYQRYEFALNNHSIGFLSAYFEYALGVIPPILYYPYMCVAIKRLHTYRAISIPFYIL